MEKRYQQKQTRDTSASNKSHRQKSFDVQRSTYQAKDAGPSRPHTLSEAAYSRTSDHRRTSSTTDLTIQPRERNAPQHSSTRFQTRQDIWNQPRQDDYHTSNSRPRPSHTEQYVWRPKQGDYRMSNLGNAGRLNEIPVLAGGSGPDDSSNQQQTHNPPTQERVYSHESGGHETWTQRAQPEQNDRSAKPESISNSQLLEQSSEAFIQEVLRNLHISLVNEVEARRNNN